MQRSLFHRGVSASCATAALALGISVPAAANTWYVRRDAGLGGDGTSWGSAFYSVQDGLAAAQAGDEVWVAAAVYRPGTGASPRSVTFQLKTGVALYGGFAGVEAGLDQRDPSANETVLSGDLLLDDAPDFANRADNCFHVVTATGSTSSRLDGFVIQGGNADASGGGYGGGILGGGNPIYANLVVRDNRATQRGGGYYSGTATQFTRCSFLGNQAGTSGAIEVSQAELTMTDCLVAGNSSASHAGAISVDFGGWSRFTNCIVVGNTTGTGAGGLWFDYTNAVISNCVVAYNHGSPYGGAVHSGLAAGYVRNSIFWGNTVVQQDGFGLEFSAVQGAGGPLDVDPAWVNPLGPDGLAGTADDDFRLSCLSPLIDRGSNALVPFGITTDHAGNPRFVDDPATPDQGSGTAPIVDIGPYEFQCGCDDVSSYCTALPNSTGAAAAIGWSGSTSLTANDFTLLVTNAVPAHFGVFFYGTDQVEIPWGDGVRCVGGSLYRLPALQLDENGAGAWHLDFSQWPATGGPGAILPGSQWNLEFYYRDQAGGPAGWNAADALHASFCP